MRSPWKIISGIAVGLVALVAIVVTAGFFVARTDWFQNFAKKKIVAAAEDATGGRAEIGSFHFDPAQLRAVITDFVVHGNEPPGAAPYLRVHRAEVDARLLLNLNKIVDITYLGLDGPQANILVYPDGRTNVPTPKTRSTSNQRPLETVVDLAVDHAELTGGLLTFNSRRQLVQVRANNLRVQLAYDTRSQGYQGRISLEPLYVASGRNTPVNFAINLPLTLERDRIDLHNATISTTRSQISIDGSLYNLSDPKTSAHLQGHIALADLKNAAELPIQLNAGNTPSVLTLEGNATVGDNATQVSGFRLGLGHSTLEASGKWKDAAGNSSLAFSGRLALGELSRLTNVSARMDGTLALSGTARMDAANHYLVAGNIAGQGLSIQRGSNRISNINLRSDVHVDPHLVGVRGFVLQAFGAELAADASVEDFARFEVNGNLRHLDIGTTARSLGQNLPYEGTVQGPISAQGDLKAPGTKAIAAHTRLSIVPGQRGIPVSGRLNGDYQGSTDNIDVHDSYIALPNTRLTLSGSVGTRMDVALTSRDLHDLLAAVPSSGPPPVSLNGGQLNLTALITGKLTSPNIDGHLAMNRFQVKGRPFDVLAVDVKAASTGANISNGTLSRGPMQTSFVASVGLNDWKATPTQPLMVRASVTRGDLAEVMGLAGQPNSGYSGLLTADANVTGTVGSPRGSASLHIAQGAIKDEPFDNIDGQVDLKDQLVTIPTVSIAAGAGRVNLNAEFHHPRDSFATGQLHAQVRSNQVDLARLRTVQKERPHTAGQVQVDADLVANLSQNGNRTEFLPSSVNADLTARALQFEGVNYGDFTATAHTSGQMVTYHVTSDFAGSNLRVNGNTQLVRGYPTNADASLARLPIERVLALAKQNIPAKGTLSGSAHFAGTIQNPEGRVDLDLANAVLYDEPLDHVRLRGTYAESYVDLPQLELTSGPSRLDATARFDHPPQSLQAGNIRFHVNSSRLDLARIRNAQKIRPGIGGVLEISAKGAGTLSQTGARVAFHELNADIAAKGIAAQGRNFGDLTLTAHNTGNRVDFELDSNLAGSAVHGNGNAQLGGNYPLTAKLTFDNVAWSHIQPLVGQGGAPGFEALAAGQVEVSGPVTKTDELRGSLQLTKAALQAPPQPGTAGNQMIFQNDGPVTASLDKGMVRIQSLHIRGPKTDLQANGTLALQAKTVTASVKGNSNLEMLQQFSREIVSSGDLALSADVRGTTANPMVNGRIELHDVSINYTEIRNGITKANGVVQFNGNSAVVQNLTAEVGGGKVVFGGSASYANEPRFALHANATRVRVRVQQGLSVVVDTNVQLTGGTKASVASGTVTVDEITYASTSDVGSILTKAAPPVENASAPSPLVDNMKLDIQARTSPGLIVQADMAESLSLDANLQVRGTASHPSILGRVNVNSGQLVFFSSTYNVNLGSISFYNPIRIEPVLNLSLETQTKGVDVTLRVTGPIDNMNLSYTSDPPLKFQEIVNLLASGKTPTSDPNILANQPSEPPQSFEQMGESAIVSKAIANPVASRLQRVFGVSQLNIDPTFTSGSDVPATRVTLQQRITTNMTFTYVTALNNPNSQIIRVQWDVNPQWSAIANRDQNGIVSIRLLYKKQFR
jgi:translocation and assembly module TamB